VSFLTTNEVEYIHCIIQPRFARVTPKRSIFV